MKNKSKLVLGFYKIGKKKKTKGKKKKKKKTEKKKELDAQRGARTHDPEIKSLMLYRLS